MELLGKVYGKLGRDNIFFMAAGLAFTVITTLIPVIVLLFAAIGYALAYSDTATAQAVATIRRLLPFASEEIIGTLLAVVQSRGTIGAIGLVGLVWVATGVVSSIRTVLNTIFEFEETRSLVAGKLFDLAMVFVLGVFFLLSLGLTATFTVLRDFGVEALEAVGIASGWVAPTAALGAALVVNVCMFTLLYTAAPAGRVPLSTALAGGVVTAILFELAKQAFRVYIGLARAGTLGPASGSLGAIILLLLWIYYSTLAFILGAEAAFALDRRRARLLARIEARRRAAIAAATDRSAEQADDQPQDGEAGGRSKKVASL